MRSSYPFLLVLLACGSPSTPKEPSPPQTTIVVEADSPSGQEVARGVHEERANGSTNAEVRPPTSPPERGPREERDLFANAAPKILAAPPFAAVTRTPLPTARRTPPVIQKISATKNSITDHAEWLKANGVSLDLYELPSGVTYLEGPRAPSLAGARGPLPSAYGSYPLVKAIRDGERELLLYGKNFAQGRFLAIVKDGVSLEAFFDFGSFLVPPSFVRSEANYVNGSVHWATVHGGVLYVSTGHMTYAASSHGKNAFISAINLSTGDLLWQSAPLVSNAANFLVRGGYILSGYGFTKEPDFLYVLDKDTGSTRQKIPVTSGPEYIFEKNGQLLVRTYDTNYVFSIR